MIESIFRISGPFKARRNDVTEKRGAFGVFAVEMNIYPYGDPRVVDFTVTKCLARNMPRHRAIAFSRQFPKGSLIFMRRSFYHEQRCEARYRRIKDDYDRREGRTYASK